MSKQAMSLAGIGIATVATALATVQYLPRRHTKRLRDAAQAGQDLHRFEDEGGTPQSPAATPA